MSSESGTASRANLSRGAGAGAGPPLPAQPVINVLAEDGSKATPAFDRYASTGSSASLTAGLATTSRKPPSSSARASGLRSHMDLSPAGSTRGSAVGLARSTRDLNKSVLAVHGGGRGARGQLASTSNLHRTPSSRLSTPQTGGSRSRMSLRSPSSARVDVSRSELQQWGNFYRGFHDGMSNIDRVLANLSSAKHVLGSASPLIEVPTPASNNTAAPSRENLASRSPNRSTMAPSAGPSRTNESYLRLDADGSRHSQGGSTSPLGHHSTSLASAAHGQGTSLTNLALSPVRHTPVPTEPYTPMHARPTTPADQNQSPQNGSPVAGSMASVGPETNTSYRLMGRDEGGDPHGSEMFLASHQPSSSSPVRRSQANMAALFASDISPDRNATRRSNLALNSRSPGAGDRTAATAARQPSRSPSRSPASPGISRRSPRRPSAEPPAPPPPPAVDPNEATIMRLQKRIAEKNNTISNLSFRVRQMEREMQWARVQGQANAAAAGHDAQHRTRIRELEGRLARDGREMAAMAQQLDLVRTETRRLIEERGAYLEAASATPVVEVVAPAPVVVQAHSAPKWHPNTAAAAAALDAVVQCQTHGLESPYFPQFAPLLTRLSAFCASLAKPTTAAVDPVQMLERPALSLVGDVCGAIQTHLAHLLAVDQMRLLPTMAQIPPSPFEDPVPEPTASPPPRPAMSDSGVQCDLMPTDPAPTPAVDIPSKALEEMEERITALVKHHRARSHPQEPAPPAPKPTSSSLPFVDVAETGELDHLIVRLLSLKRENERLRRRRGSRKTASAGDLAVATVAEREDTASDTRAAKSRSPLPDVPLPVEPTQQAAAPALPPKYLEEVNSLRDAVAQLERRLNAADRDAPAPRPRARQRDLESEYDDTEHEADGGGWDGRHHIDIRMGGNNGGAGHAQAAQQSAALVGTLTAQLETLARTNQSLVEKIAGLEAQVAKAAAVPPPPPPPPAPATKEEPPTHDGYHYRPSSPTARDIEIQQLRDAESARVVAAMQDAQATIEALQAHVAVRDAEIAHLRGHVESLTATATAAAEATLAAQALAVEDAASATRWTPELDAVVQQLCEALQVQQQQAEEHLELLHHHVRNASASPAAYRDESGPATTTTQSLASAIHAHVERSGELERALDRARDQLAAQSKELDETRAALQKAATDVQDLRHRESHALAEARSQAALVSAYETQWDLLKSLLASNAALDVDVPSIDEPADHGRGGAGSAHPFLSICRQLVALMRTQAASVTAATERTARAEYVAQEVEAKLADTRNQAERLAELVSRAERSRNDAVRSAQERVRAAEAARRIAQAKLARVIKGVYLYVASADRTIVDAADSSDDEDESDVIEQPPLRPASGRGSLDGALGLLAGVMDGLQEVDEDALGSAFVTEVLDDGALASDLLTVDDHAAGERVVNYAVNNGDPWAAVMSPSVDKPAESAAEAALRYREKDLERREAALAAKESEIRAREQKIEEVTSRQFNWPKFKPILYHSIEKEIPAKGRPVVQRMYYLWMFSVWTYVINCIACLSALITKHSAGGSMFVMSFLIMVIGVPTSWSFWYKQLYDGARDDKSIRFFLFFLNFAFHLGATVILGVGVPGWGGAGIIVTIEQFSQNLGSAIICIIATVSLGFQFFFGIWGLKDVTYYYRSMGMSMEKAKREAVQEAATSQAGQALLKESAKQAVATKVGQTPGARA
ncbi:hypothetical protein H9P43_001717 [Blastocladiella emersonii ATCC 22665]|nr:hypothetical protein H9P43_001717 [Blastocladiella emersonii ATCC 22665]